MTDREVAVRQHRWRAPATLVVAVAASMVLAGCMSPSSHVTATINDGELELDVCELRGDTDTISVSAWPLDSQSQSHSVLWSATGDGQFGPGDTITYGVAPTGFETAVGPTTFDVGSSRIVASITGFFSGVRSSQVWVINGDELVDDKWLDQFGVLHDEPCG